MALQQTDISIHLTDSGSSHTDHQRIADEREFNEMKTLFWSDKITNNRLTVLLTSSKKASRHTLFERIKDQRTNEEFIDQLVSIIPYIKVSDTTLMSSVLSGETKPVSELVYEKLQQSLEAYSSFEKKQFIAFMFMKSSRIPREEAVRFYQRLQPEFSKQEAAFSGICLQRVISSFSPEVEFQQSSADRDVYTAEEELRHCVETFTNYASSEKLLFPTLRQADFQFKNPEMSLFAILHALADSEISLKHFKQYAAEFLPSLTLEQLSFLYQTPQTHVHPAITTLRDEHFQKLGGDPTIPFISELRGKNTKRLSSMIDTLTEDDLQKVLPYLDAKITGSQSVALFFVRNRKQPYSEAELQQMYLRSKFSPRYSEPLDTVLPAFLSEDSLLEADSAFSVSTQHNRLLDSSTQSLYFAVLFQVDGKTEFFRRVVDKDLEFQFEEDVSSSRGNRQATSTEELINCFVYSRLSLPEIKNTIDNKLDRRFQTNSVKTKLHTLSKLTQLTTDKELLTQVASSESLYKALEVNLPLSEEILRSFVGSSSKAPSKRL